MQVNALAVVVAVVAGMLVGAVWYGPVFGRAWRVAAGLAPDHTPRDPARVYGLAVVATALTAVVLAGLAPFVAEGLGSPCCPLRW